MSAFTRAVNFVLLHEGGLVEDARGGLTNHGISQRAYPDLDIAGLTREQAVSIYRADYWQAARCDLLPAPLDFALFDGAVQHGVQAATRLLQRALRVDPDGILGPVTHAAASTAPVRPVLSDYLARRGMLYAELAEPTLLRGWLTRLFDLALESGESR